MTPISLKSERNAVARRFDRRIRHLRGQIRQWPLDDVRRGMAQLVIEELHDLKRELCNPSVKGARRTSHTGTEKKTV